MASATIASADLPVFTHDFSAKRRRCSITWHKDQAGLEVTVTEPEERPEPQYQGCVRIVGRIHCSNCRKALKLFSDIVIKYRRIYVKDYNRYARQHGWKTMEND
jgi:hypothetical protein